MNKLNRFELKLFANDDTFQQSISFQTVVERAVEVDAVVAAVVAAVVKADDMVVVDDEERVVVFVLFVVVLLQLHEQLDLRLVVVVL